MFEQLHPEFPNVLSDFVGGIEGTKDEFVFREAEFGNVFVFVWWCFGIAVGLEAMGEVDEFFGVVFGMRWGGDDSIGDKVVDKFGAGGARKTQVSSLDRGDSLSE